MDNNKAKPICLYCGTPMALEDNSEGAYWYECYKCGATAPTEETEQAAYTAAMQRWQEPNRVLALKEIKKQQEVWLEENIGEPRPAIFYVNGYPHHSVFIGKFDDSDDFDSDVWYDNEDYGVDWRCWRRKPTQEEMAGTPWEGGQHEKD